MKVYVSYARGLLWLLGALWGGSWVGAESVDFVTPTATATYHQGEFNWSRSCVMDFFVAEGEAEIARCRTRLHFMYDEKMLRIGLSAEEGDMPAIRLAFAKGRPERVRADDSVSLYVRRGARIYEVTVASDGKFDDILWQDGKEDPSWDSGATWEIDRPDEWRGLLEIPWSSLGVTDVTPLSVLDFAAVRRERPVGEISGWPGCGGSKALPTQWAALALGGKKAGSPFMRNWVVTQPAPGPQRFLWYLHPLPTSCSVEILIRENGKVRRLPCTYSEPWNDGFRHGKFSLPAGVPVAFQSILRVGGAIIHASAVVPVPTPLLTAQIQAALDRVEEIERRLVDVEAEFARQRLATAARPVRAALVHWQEVAGVALAQPPSPERNAQLAEAVGKVEVLLWRSHMLEGRMAALAGGAAAPSFSVGTMHSLRKLMPWMTNVAFGEPLRLRAAGRERDSAQIVVIPFDRPLAKVTVTWGNLQGPDGAVISKGDLRIDRVGYVKTRTPPYTTEYVGWWPDPLLPLEPFDVPLAKVQPLWVTVAAREDTPAGLYTGAVSIDAGDAGTFTVPIEARVLDYDLPLRGKLRTALGGMFSRTVSVWYGYGYMENSITTPPQIPQSVRREVYAFLLDHRISPCGLYEQHVFPDKEDVDFCLERGMNTLFLSYSPKASDKETVAYLKEWRAFLAERDALDVAVIYGWDEIESRPEQFPTMLEEWSALKKEIPDIPFSSTIMTPHPEWDSFIDTWIPHMVTYDREAWDAHRAGTGDQVWWYSTCETPPFAGVLMDIPALKHRILFWQNYKYDVPGYLYYAIFGWTGNFKSEGEARWPDVPWVTNEVHGNHNGCGQLVYPGKDGLLASIRLAVIRDGIEDYEAFALLAELTDQLDPDGLAALIAENREILAVDDTVCKSLIEYTMNPEVLLSARRRLDEAIEKTSKVLARQD